MALRIAGFVCSALLVIGCGNSEPAPEASMTDSAVADAATPFVPPTTDAELLANAKSAAPPAVSEGAMVLAFNGAMEPRTLQAGTNGWTCLPDMAHSPGNDPMCLDEGGMAWAQAWMAQEPPPADTMGFGYMLMAGSDASNEDPFATAPVAGAEWVVTGPHVMVFNTASRFPGYPRTAADPSRPYVMFPDTPYEHLMIPVR